MLFGDKTHHQLRLDDEVDDDEADDEVDDDEADDEVDDEVVTIHQLILDQL